VFLQNDDLHVTVGHTHPADPVGVEAEKVKTAMRGHMKSVRAQPSQVLAAAMRGTTNDVSAVLGRQDSIKWNLRRYIHLLWSPARALTILFYVRFFMIQVPLT